MSNKAHIKTTGFTLVETMVATFVMALVITGALVGLGQASLLSEKSRKQAVADFVLRAETERFRSMDWDEISNLSDTISVYEINNSGDPYPVLQAVPAADLLTMGMAAETKWASLDGGSATGRRIFNVTLNWADRLGRAHEESRIFIITEGGFSAD